MLGDNIEVQLEVQEKWDVVNNELRAKMKCGRSDHFFRNIRHAETVNDDAGSSDEEMNS